MIGISFILNGKPYKTAVEPGEMLLDTLRERIGLTGTKRGCEVGECGACTVLIDDKAVDSCLYPAALADGHSVVTIEGINCDKVLSDIQKAFIDKGAVQCGFCTPGMILSAYAFLKAHPDPTGGEIRQGMAGNFCRCGAYGHIIEAVESVSENDNETESRD